MIKQHRPYDNENKGYLLTEIASSAYGLCRESQSICAHFRILGLQNRRWNVHRSRLACSS